MPRPTGLHRSVSAAPRGSTRGGASQRVTETALWVCRTVATGGRTAMRQRSPRAGTFAPGCRTKLSRKWGPGGRRLRAPLGARRSRPPAIFSPLLDRSKRGSPPRRRNVPQIKRYGTKPAGGASPSPTAGRRTRRANTPGGPVSHPYGWRAQWSRPTGLHRSMPAAPRGSNRGGASKRVAQTAL